MKRRQQTKHCVSDTRQQHVRRLLLSALLCFTFRFAQSIEACNAICVLLLLQKALHSFIHPIWNWWQYLCIMYMRYLCFPSHYFLFSFFLFVVFVSRNLQLFFCFSSCLLRRLMDERTGRTIFREVSVDLT